MPTAHIRAPASKPGLSKGALGPNIFLNKEGPAAFLSQCTDVAELSSEHKASVFAIPVHLGLFTRLIWNNKSVPTLLAPASLHPRPMFEDVFKFWAYTQQTPWASSWLGSTGEGGHQDTQGLLVAGPAAQPSRESEAALVFTRCLLFHVKALS